MNATAERALHAWRTRIVASVLAGFSIAGGFLVLIVNGAGPLSLDRRRGRS
jgi:uncharacterized membrane protein YphA (DoxX/SURF4 family)